MYILEILLPGDEDPHFHSKKLSKSDRLRLTEKTSEAQTYNSLGSAKAGIGVFKDDLSMELSLSRWSDDRGSVLRNRVVELRKKGHTFKVTIRKAVIIPGNIVELKNI